MVPPPCCKRRGAPGGRNSEEVKAWGVLEQGEVQASPESWRDGPGAALLTAALICRSCDRMGAP